MDGTFMKYQKAQALALFGIRKEELLQTIMWSVMQTGLMWHLLTNLPGRGEQMNSALPSTSLDQPRLLASGS